VAIFSAVGHRTILSQRQDLGRRVWDSSPEAVAFSLNYTLIFEHDI